MTRETEDQALQESVEEIDVEMKMKEQTEAGLDRGLTLGVRRTGRNYQGWL